jgi:hypothetical protein
MTLNTVPVVEVALVIQKCEHVHQSLVNHESHYPLISRWSFLCELSDLNRVWLSCKYEQPFVMHDSFWDWMAIHLNRLLVQLLCPHDYSSVVGDSNRKAVILHDNWLAFCMAQLGELSQSQTQLA